MQITRITRTELATEMTLNIPRNIKVRPDGVTWDIRVTYLDEEKRRREIKRVCRTRDPQKIKKQVERIKQSINRNRRTKTSAPKPRKPAGTPLTAAEFEQALSFCTGRYAHLKPFIIAVRNGLPKQDVTALRWRQVSFPRREIRIKSKTYPMSDELFEVLTRWHTRRGSNLLVLGGIKDVRHAWATVTEKIGRPDARIRDLKRVESSAP
jgi:hypothetical protein